MQANCDTKYVTQVGHLSNVKAGCKVSHSGEASHLNEMSHLI